MKPLHRWLSRLGSAFLIMTATCVVGWSADRKNPLRGTWSFSQFVPATTVLGTPNPVPLTATGTLTMAADYSFTAHGVFDIPTASALDLDLNGSCSLHNGNISNGLDCRLNVPSLGLSEGRFCVAKAMSDASCFDQFRCVDTDLVGTVLLVEYTRQHLGTCD